jgi:ribosomal protein L20
MDFELSNEMKMLADMAVRDPQTFAAVVAKAKEA